MLVSDIPTHVCPDAYLVIIAPREHARAAGGQREPAEWAISGDLTHFRESPHLLGLSAIVRTPLMRC